MFRKLLKYEWRANAKLFMILSLAALGVGILGGVVARAALYLIDTSTNDVALVLTVPGMYILFMFCCIALVAYMAAVEIINLARFYKNKFTDQGYLTFTLPVRAQQIYLSAFVNMLLWLLISAAVMVFCFAVMFLIGFGDTIVEIMEDVNFQYMWQEVLAVFTGLRDEVVTTRGYGLYTVLMYLLVALSPLYAISMMMGCLTVGSVLVRKYKILASIGIYYGLNMVVSGITSTLTSFITLRSIDADNFFVVYNTASVCQLVLMVGVTVGSYFLSTHLMKNKLNLP